MEPLKKIYKIGYNKSSIQDGGGVNLMNEVSSTIQHVVEIALKLTNNACYDTSKRLIFNGCAMEGTDIANLLAHAMSKSKIDVKLKGLPEFVFILRKNGVDPEYIENSSIKTMLSRCSKVTDIVGNSIINGPIVLTNTEEVKLHDYKNSELEKLGEPVANKSPSKKNALRPLAEKDRHIN